MTNDFGRRVEIGFAMVAALVTSPIWVPLYAIGYVAEQVMN